jgi:hypothetical protein
MAFIKYQHLERFGTTEVLNIEHGEIHIFPKIDGTNGSLWMEYPILKAGSRNRDLTLDNDNAGFYQWAKGHGNLIKFFYGYPDLRLYGEWLVPHSLKTYREDAWKKFYVFDVCRETESGELEYLPFSEYELLLKHHNIDYITPLAIVKNCTYERLINYLEGNNFLIKDGEGCGEGIVIKNYTFKNRYGRTTWAKIVTSEFREKHIKEMGASYVDMKPPIEQDIVETFVTKALVDKVYSKIETEQGFTSRQIPQLLNTVFYDLVREDCWTFVKKHKNPSINFSMLQHLTYSRVKQLKAELF